jgi:hypothetical protein
MIAAHIPEALIVATLVVAVVVAFVVTVALTMLLPGPWSLAAALVPFAALVAYSWKQER